MSQVEASGLVAALEAVWVAIQERHPDVPDVVVTLGAGSIGVPAGTLKLGHFAASRWVAGGTDAVAELFVGGEGLARGAESVLETLLHEAAHGVAHVRDIKDTSRGGRYHNRRFATLGNELGLRVTQEPQIGWSGTQIHPETAETYVDELHDLAVAITAHRHAEGFLPGLGPGDGTNPEGPDGSSGGDGKASGGRPKNGVVLACECGRKIRCSTTVAEAGPIVCGVCGASFVEAA